MASNGVVSWSTTAANNVLANTGVTWDEGMAPSSVNDSARQTMADIRGEWAETSISAAGTVNIGATLRGFVHISGSASISSFDTISAGIRRRVMFEAATAGTLVHDATKFILPGATNISPVVGDCAEFISEGSGNWRCLAYTKASAAPITLSPITNSIAADVSLNNTGLYFTGPTVAQGTAGTWFVSGKVTVHDTAGIAAVDCKLWDGTTVIDSARVQFSAASTPLTCSLSGYITNPAGNLRISCKDVTSTSGGIVANQSGNAKDSTITAIRIA